MADQERIVKENFMNGYSHIAGLIAAPYTPMNQNGDINLLVIEQYANHLLNSGVDAVFICGTTGEGISLKPEERKALMEEWSRCAGHRLKIICHVGSNCLPDCQELAAHAGESGAYATAAFAPSFFRPGSVKDLVSFLAPIAASAPGIPFYYYHIPSMTGVTLAVSDIMTVAAVSIPNFAGVKFTHSDFYEMQRCLDFEKGKYQVLHGNDETLLCALSLGVTAAVGSTYNFMPGVYLNILDAFRDADMVRARKWQQYSVKFVNMTNKYGGGGPTGKAIMKLIGLDCGPFRLPVKGLTESEINNLKNELKELKFFEVMKEFQTNQKIRVPPE